MMQRTSIEWTSTPRADGSLEPGFTSNPLKFRDANGRVVWACVHASRGCERCYAESLAKRFGKGGPFNVPTMNGLTPFLDEAELRKILTAKRVGGVEVAGSRVFLGDMTDIFGEWVPDELLDRLFAVMALRPDVTFQVLTKRAKRMREYLSHADRSTLVARQIPQFHPKHTWESARAVIFGIKLDEQPARSRWPLPNVSAGVSCESPDYLWRLDELKDTPAAVHFVSLEPLIADLGAVSLDGIEWVIVGGESGAGARRCDVAWIRSIVRQCQRADVSCFVKQLGSQVIDRNDAGYEGDDHGSWPMDTDTRDHINGYREVYQGAPVRVILRSRKGGDPAEWPEELRVREFPRSAVPA